MKKVLTATLVLLCCVANADDVTYKNKRDPLVKGVFKKYLKSIDYFKAHKKLAPYLSTSRKIPLAIVEEGAYTDHPDLKSTTKINGSSSYGKMAHGTVTAGVIASEIGNGIGTEGIFGYKDILKLDVYKTDTNTMTVSNKIKDAVKHNFAVNVSWEYFYRSYFNTGLSYAKRYNSVVVFCAGNHGLNLSRKSFQNDYPLLTVGVLDKNLNRHKVSNFGTGVDLYAGPYQSTQCGLYKKGCGWGDDGYGGLTWTTSFAAPQVTGAVGMAQAYARGRYNKTIEKNKLIELIKLGTIRVKGLKVLNLSELLYQIDIFYNGNVAINEGAFIFSPKIFNLKYYQQKYKLTTLSDNEIREHWKIYGISRGYQANENFALKEYQQLYGKGPNMVMDIFAYLESLDSEAPHDGTLMERAKKVIPIIMN